MNAAEARPALAVLAETPAVLEKLLQAATAEQMQWKPAPERWSISEVLAHLVEIERVFRERVQRIAEQESPPIASYDQEQAYRRGDYSSGRAEEHLQRFHRERESTLQRLHALPDAALFRRGRHSEIGEFTLGELLQEWAFHDLGHIRQIAELYRAQAFYPHMGGFRRYYTVKP
ncbi:MAG: DinB family protein [Acidobacteriia bacterium]|jgi:uncharacterized damage-inducible protein DinB|nr:DinB family protein [Terriglobia bacterium]